MFDFLDKNAPSKVTEKDIDAAQTIIAAGKRVKQVFGIQVDTKDLERALISTDETPRLIAALAEQDLPILDTEAVRQYKQQRLNHTKRERFTHGAENLLEKIHSAINWNSEPIFAFCFIMVTFGIPFWIDQLWYEVEYLPSILLSIMIQGTIIGMFSDNGLDEFEEFLPLYAVLTALILAPILLIGSLALPWLSSDTSKRSWKTMSAKDFLGKEVTDAFAKPIALMALASEVVPPKAIQFDVLHDEKGNPTSEAFLVVDVPGLKEERLYLWYGR
jgi:hypothetical protein